MQDQVFTPFQEEVLRIAFRHLDKELGLDKFNQEEQFAKLWSRLQEVKDETDE
jgi:hypothetical protein